MTDAEIIDFETYAPLSQLYLELEKLRQAEELITMIAMEYRPVPEDLEDLPEAQLAHADNLKNLERLRDRGVESYDVVVTDLRLPGASGIDVLRTARERDARTAVVLMTAYGSIQTAVEAMKLGAFDFLEKPLDMGRVLTLAIISTSGHPAALNCYRSFRYTF